MSQFTPGFFVTLEGADAAGKSSHVEALKTYLEQSTGRTVVMTREPGGTELAEQLRILIKTKDMSPATETLIINAARQDHLDKLIRPALASGQIVICDRFTDSTYAYQGGIKKIPIDKIAALEEWVQEDIRPDLTLYFDVPLHVSKARRSLRGETNDRLENAMDANFNALRDMYISLANNNPQRIIVIDGSQSIEQVRVAVFQSLDRFLLRKKIHTVNKEHHTASISVHRPTVLL